MPTNIALELQEQGRWRLRPPYAGWTLFDQLVRNEFLPPEEQYERLQRRVKDLLDFVAAAVPFYSRSFAGRGRGAGKLWGMDDLRALPILTRMEVQGNQVELGATFLPPGEVLEGFLTTSGSTGQPLQIDHTQRSLTMFCALKQRELRWFRYDSSGRLAIIRSGRDLPMLVGTGTPEDMPREVPCWPQVGRHFETGPCFGAPITLSLDRQMQWLEQIQPDYLMSLSANLEHLAFGWRERRPAVAIRALQAISMQLTPSMRRFIEQVFDAPVNENYGLNEIGLVASRCPEGGRFHVHQENCFVEIVNDKGVPCRPGERGHLVVTGFGNLAMPMLRYDTGDLADAVEGPCPCGRTLPTFGAIQGRYRRIAFLPPGAWDRWMSLRKALVEAPPELLRGLRQFQLHQYRDGRFELRLVMAGHAPSALLERLQGAWPTLEGLPPASLQIIEVDSIPLPPGGKFQDFTSDFIPPPDEPGPQQACP